MPRARGVWKVSRRTLSMGLAMAIAAMPVVPQTPMILMDGTPIKMRLNRNLSSESARVGDTVDFDVLEDVMVNGLVVIQQGSKAMATVTEARAKRRMGKAGVLDVNIDFARLVTGEKVPLRAVREHQGDSTTGSMTAGMVVTSIVFFPAAPFFLFMKGKEVTIPKGTEITSYVHSDVRLDETRLRTVAVNANAPGVPGVAAPQPAAASAAPQPVAAGEPVAPAQASAPVRAAPKGAMTNSDVLDLKRAGFSDDLIIAKIKSSAAAFELETSDMIQLKKAGLSDKVIGAMMAKMN